MSAHDVDGDVLVMFAGLGIFERSGGDALVRGPRASASRGRSCRGLSRA